MQEAEKSIEWFMECAEQKSAEISDKGWLYRYNRQVSIKRMDVKDIKSDVGFCL